jgi:DNA-3-methyladenine glycosylase
MPLPQTFYDRDPAAVARELLGQTLVVCKEQRLEGKIVETEAYYGLSDPASRASQDGMSRRSRWMWDAPGTTFVYMVHGYWLFNVITESEGTPSGVLIRAVEPLMGIETMQRRRDRERIRDLTSGPGKLTIALGIDKSDNGRLVYRQDSPVHIARGENIGDGMVATSRRIGVTEDLPRDLRFYVEGNPLVSR